MCFPCCQFRDDLSLSLYSLSLSQVWLVATLLDCSPPGPVVHGISQASILEWVAFSFSGGYSWPRDSTCISCLACEFFTTEPSVKPSGMMCVCCVLSHFSCVRLFETQSLLSSSVHRIFQARIPEWVAISSPGEIPDPETERHLLCFLNWKVGSLPLAPQGKPSFLNHHHNFRQNECLLLSSTMEGFGNISESRSIMSDSLQPHGLYSPWNSPG